MRLILNVALARSDEASDNTIIRTVAALNRQGFLLQHGEVVEYQGARLLVGEFEYAPRIGKTNTTPTFDDVKWALWHVCNVLHLDSIAGTYLDNGFVAGPKGGDWAPFPSDSFQRLAA